VRRSRLEKWPQAGAPANPGGGLTTTAGNRAVDRIRREKQRDAKHRAAFMYYDDTPHEPPDRSRTTGCGRCSPAATRRPCRKRGSR
jgi:predicted RNA polymerase sigma factor